MTLKQIFLTAALISSAGPLDAQARWRLDEIVRIGGDDEGLASFNQIIDIQLGSDGKVWVLDRQTQSLRLFAADGTPLKEVARHGRGPGELNNANGVRRGPDGRMWVRDHSNQRLTSFGPDGSLVGQHMVPSTGYGWRWDGAIDPEGRVLDLIGVRRGENYERMITRYRPDLSQGDTIPLPTTCSNLPAPRSSIAAARGFITFPFAARYVMVPSSDGALWCANSDEYRPRRFPFGATRHDRELSLTPPRVPISRAERDSAIAVVDSFLARQGGATEPWARGDVPRDRSAFGWMEVDDQGRLWVRRELPDRSYEFDVWDTNGRRIAVMVAPPGAAYIPLYRIVGDRLVTIVTDEDDLPYVVVYRIRTS